MNIYVLMCLCYSEENNITAVICKSTQRIIRKYKEGCQLSFSDLHGQVYDGESAMSGAISGVAKLNEERPNAHCTQ